MTWVSVSSGNGFLTICSWDVGQNGRLQTALDCELFQVRDGVSFTSAFSVPNTVPGAMLALTTDLENYTEPMYCPSILASVEPKKLRALMYFHTLLAKTHPNLNSDTHFLWASTLVTELLDAITQGRQAININPPDRPGLPLCQGESDGASLVYLLSHLSQEVFWTSAFLKSPLHVFLAGLAPQKPSLG